MVWLPQQNSGLKAGQILVWFIDIARIYSGDTSRLSFPGRHISHMR